MRFGLPLVVLMLIAALPLRAQDPTISYRTIRTDHFAVHYPPNLEPLARRAAASGERAYARLAAELVRPRGTIDLVLTDNNDFANGSATPFPSNRIVIYAHPPIEGSLRYNDDWMDIVVTHELAHVFHLDRSRGMWRMAQYVFGRSPFFFPNAYSPRWLTEGLATYYESKLTGTGRLRGSAHTSIAEAHAFRGSLPRLDQVSVATPVFPGGSSVYVYGSLLVDHLARTRGEDRIRALVERQAVHPVPFILNRVARVAFGVTYSDAWRELTDSLVRAAGEEREPLPQWRDLSPASFAADFLRWTPDTTLTYTGSAPRELYGAYEVSLDGERDFVGRRNGATPNVRTADGTLVYAQPDFVDPYNFRGDLYIERGGARTRLTRDARLSAPDVTGDGRVVAVQSVPGGARLVRFDLATRTLTPITSGGPDEYWMEPRWSPDGRRIAAAHWRRGGVASVRIVDADGRLLDTLAIARAVISTPSWSPDGAWLYFSSDVGGHPEIWAVQPGGTPRRVTAGSTALYDPQVSPDGRLLAASRLTAEGFRVGVGPLAASPQAGEWPGTPIAPYDSVVPVTTPSTAFNPFRQLLPRFWLPVVESDERGPDERFGFFTQGHDILGRHTWSASAAFPFAGHGITGALGYQYAGFRWPILGLSLSQDVDFLGTVRNTESHVYLREREAMASAVFVRPRVRSSLLFSVAGGGEWQVGQVAPFVRTTLDTTNFFDERFFPRATAGISYARVRAAPYAISAEDGVTLSLSGTNRWVNGWGDQASRTFTGAATGYRSFAAFGFARHVLALRVAGGVTDTLTTDPLEVGGTSGSEIPVLFGTSSIGEGRRTFGVRGFDGATLYGTRAWAASAEYRLPLRLFARGLGVLPVFLDRTSLALFGDAGSAWCPVYSEFTCSSPARETLASVGAEARVNTAIATWDTPYQFRFGVALPVQGGERKVKGYLTAGVSF